MKVQGVKRELLIPLDRACLAFFAGGFGGFDAGEDGRGTFDGGPS
ncbi:hypothetical protein [Arenibacter palladensis]|nr:hypothetical protein [Arenibacter palladensis]MDO6605550.1 hypothetical protein [Arenibacter palladensis]